MTDATVPRGAVALPLLRGRLRAEVVLPLLGAYLALAALYAWQAWRRETPTIFTDELEYTQLARSVAETGTPARRGEPLGFTSLVPYLSAPAWWIGSVSTAYAVLKYAQALVMLLAMFPAYGIARLVCSRRFAVAAAIGAGVAPALAYSPILVEEPYAYPAATLALWLTGRAVCRPSVRAFALAGAGAAVAALTRSQLAAVVAVSGLCLLAVLWRTERLRAWRSTWSRGDWVGFAVLVVGGVLAGVTLLGELSPTEWGETTALYKDRIFTFGAWAGGAFVVGLGFFPVVASLTALVRPRAQYRDPGTRAWVTLAAASFLAFVTYAAVKGAYLSTVFSSLVVERNLIYLTPIVAAGAALVLERRDPVWWAALVAGALTLWAVDKMPVKLDYPYYESHGLAILALPNRLWHWPIERIEHATLLGVILGTALVLAPAAFRRHAAVARLLAVAVGVAALGWSLTTQVYAANGEYQLSSRLAANLVDPPSWIDDTVGDGTVVVFGQQLNADPTGVWEDEFWNRSITKVWSVDGTAPPPTLTPDLAFPDGTLTPSPGTDYALSYNGVELQSPVVRRIGTTILYRLAGGPLKLAFDQTGVYSDGWMGERAAYNRFAVAEDGPGLASVLLSREAFCAGEPSAVTVQVGPVTIGSDKQPALESVTDEQTVSVPPCGSQTVLLRAPRQPWRVEVRSTTFVPADVDSSLSDRRALGVRIAFGFRPRG